MRDHWSDAAHLVAEGAGGEAGFFEEAGEDSYHSFAGVPIFDRGVPYTDEQIAKQNSMQPDQLDQVLKAHGIERGALVDQLTASIVWAKLVRRLMSQTNMVSDEEIDYALKRAKETAANLRRDPASSGQTRRFAGR